MVTATFPAVGLCTQTTAPSTVPGGTMTLSGPWVGDQTVLLVPALASACGTSITALLYPGSPVMPTSMGQARQPALPRIRHLWATVRYRQLRT